MNLYELSNEYNLILQDDITLEEKEKALTEISVGILQKSAGLIKVNQNFDATVKTLDEEIKRLQAIKKSVEGKQDRFKEYVLKCMVVLGEDKLETPIGKISIKKCPMSVEVVDAAIIPKEYIKMKPEVDKAAIKEVFKQDGLMVEGTSIITDKLTIQFR